jgi:hypothetical protein
MIHLDRNWAGSVRNLWLVTLVAGLMMPGLECASLQAQASTLNVTDFGARGDALQFQVGTTVNSPVITIQSSNQLSSADVGKLILLFGAGPATGPTNHQDLIATIKQVSGGTNITMSLPAGASGADIFAICGTQNATAFQKCVDAAKGTNTVINIPAGTFLMVPPAQLTRFAKEWPVPAAVVISKGGIHFLGKGMDKTILIACGAWKLQTERNLAYRGWLFNCQGPVTQNYPLIFDSLTMDGGVQSGNTSFHGFPARKSDGEGWDETHDAVVDSGQVPLHSYKAFVNCRFTHWRGEIVKSVASGWDGYILITNSVFDDGNASGFNFTFTHDIDHCVFSNLFQVSEFYQAYCTKACWFQNNLITNITGNAMAFNGAVTNHPPPPYNIVSNTFYKSGAFIILTTPAQNLHIIGNQFNCANSVTAAIGLGCEGYQGSAINSNIVVGYNRFINTQYAVEVMGRGRNRVADVLVCSNNAEGVHNFAFGYGWSTNVSFIGNIGVSTGGLLSQDMEGQWFLDDASNRLNPTQENASADKTNIISYSFGMRHITAAAVADSAFALDDSQPQKIPSGARMLINHKGNLPARLYLSAVKSGAEPMILANGATVECEWANGVWQFIP